MCKFFFCLFLGISPLSFLAQNSGGITGIVLDGKNAKPLPNVSVTVQNNPQYQITNKDGKFLFENITAGNHIVQLKSMGYKDLILSIVVDTIVVDLGIIQMEEDITNEQQLSLISLTEAELNDDNSGSESTSGLLQSSRDAFQQAAAFNWGQARFRTRGLDNENAFVMINGIWLNFYDGRPQYSNWGGLNDATRNQEFTTGSSPSDYTFGGILGTNEINTRASVYRPGSRISFSGTNTNYSWRTMATHASGMNQNGWAFVISAGKRLAQEGYFEGTNYNANSFFCSVEKKINGHHSLNFTSIYAKNSRGKNSPNTDEVTQLAGFKYNANWGYQNGNKRNSRVKEVEEPILMLSHYWKINTKTNLNYTIAHQEGKIGNSRLDYQGADNPDPTYYRNLPSYYTSLYNPDDYTDFQGDDPANIALANTANFLTKRQLNWDLLYNTNLSTVDGHSAYILYEDRTDDKLWTANAVLYSQLADNIILNAGTTFRKLKSHNFQNVLDLLGGRFFEDYDNFQTGSEQQPDLNHPNRKVVVGDTFGYNYNLLATTFDAFTQFKFIYKKIDFYLAQTFSGSNYQRDGLYKNGLYPTVSFGKSQKYNYENFGFKGGLTYKITGRNFISFNGAYMTKAPSLRNVFPNARLNNNAINGVSSENIMSIDANYIINTPSFKTRLTTYYSKIQQATETSFFFGEGIFKSENNDGGDAFVAETVTNIDKLNIGTELGIEYQINSTLKLTTCAAYGEYIYNTNPHVALNNDNLASPTNTNPVIDFGEAKLKGYRLAGGPQSAYSIGTEYRDPKFWWIGANLNYLTNNYIDIATLLRTDNFLKNPDDSYGLPFPEATAERTAALLKQKQFEDFSLVNLTGGKSWKIKNQTYGFFASINNVFNTIYKTGGFEQTRNANFRELNQDVSSGTPAFAPKYFYGYGRTYFLNLFINFQ